MRHCYESTHARLFSLLLAVALVACGIGGCGTGIFGSTETYTVNSTDQWDISSPLGGSGYITFSKSSSGVYFTGYNTGGAAIAGLTGYSQQLLKYPVRVGDTWSASGQSSGYTVGSVTAVTNTAAQVTVAAGTFTCIETTETGNIPQGYNNGVYVSEYKRYFAPGVGLVKVINTWKNGKVSTGELQSYSVPNADPSDYFPLNLHSSWTFTWSL